MIRDTKNITEKIVHFLKMKQKLFLSHMWGKTHSIVFL